MRGISIKQIEFNHFNTGFYSTSTSRKTGNVRVEQFTVRRSSPQRGRTGRLGRQVGQDQPGSSPGLDTTTGPAADPSSGFSDIDGTDTGDRETEHCQGRAGRQQQ